MKLLILILLSAISFSQNYAQYYDELPDLGSCDEGILNDAEKQKVLDRVNEIRAMHGLDPVTYDDSGDEVSQKGALISAANGSISHTPPSSWDCWTEDGYEGNETSNLFIGIGSPQFLSNSEDHVVGWLIDENAGSDNLGHRRSIINPFLKSISYGRVDGPYSQNQNLTVTASNLKYQDFISNSDAGSFSKDYVAYPEGLYKTDYFSKSYFLSFHLFKDKSFLWANQNVDYSSATVEVFDEDDREMTVTDIAYDNVGWGSLPNQLQWKVNNLQDDVEYRVEIKNIRFDGQTIDEEYTFKLVDEVSPNLSLVSPADGAIDLDREITFDWEDYEGAEYYQVKIGTTNMQETLHDIKFLESEMDTEDLLTELTDFSWQVEAYNSSDELLSSSEVRTFSTGYFTPGSAELEYPIDGVELDTYFPELRWIQADNVTEFEISILSDDEQIHLFTTSETSHQLNTDDFDVILAEDTELTWRVRSINGNRASELVESSFVIPALPEVPEIIFPKDQETYNFAEPLEFTHQGEDYTVENDIYFESNSEKIQVEQTSLTKTTTLIELPDGFDVMENPSLFWRSRTEREEVYSDWSEIIEFFLDLSSVEYLSSDIVSIYPNPSSDIINVNSNKIIYNNYEIINSNGEILLSGSNIEMIDISSLSAGLYILKLNSKNNSGYKLFIKN